MKFSYKSNPILRLLEKKDWVSKLEIGKMITVFDEVFNRYLGTVNTDNYKIARGVITEFLSEIQDLELIKEFKILHFSKQLTNDTIERITPNKSFSLFYDFEKQDSGCILFSKDKSIIYGFRENNTLVVLTIQKTAITEIEILRIDKEGLKRKRGGHPHLSLINEGLNLMKKINPPIYATLLNSLVVQNWKPTTSWFNYVTPLLSIYYFADIENKYVHGKKIPRATIAGEKFVNQTNVPIQVIGCNWFTNIIRTAGFGVKGHFRNQACGVGLSERKLIWVSDFQKNGYTRVAQKTMVGI